jgi:hypothetical protein
MKSTNRLYSLVKPNTKTEASHKVYVHATHYPNYVRLYAPNIPYERLKLGMESVFTIKQNNYGTKTSNEDNFERSIRRTKKKISDIALCNQFDMFATFTFKDERDNIEKSKAKMANWLKNQRKRKGKFAYLIVPEFHKDGESLHFHALIKGYAGKLIEAINPRTGKSFKQKGRTVYTFASYTLGFTNVVKIENTPESHAKVSSYIRKYITKDMPAFANKNRYWSSTGLKLPRHEENPQFLRCKTTPSFTTENEHGKIYHFDISTSEQLVSHLVVSGTNQRSLTALDLGHKEIENTQTTEAVELR